MAWQYGNWGGSGWSGGRYTQPGELVDRSVTATDVLLRRRNEFNLL